MPDLPPPVFAHKPYGYFKDGHNVREIVIDDGIRELAHSEATLGILEPVGAVDYGDHGEQLWGFRRIFAYGYGLSQKLAVPEKIPVLLYPPSLTATQRRIITATENLQHQSLTDPQKYGLCKELLEMNPEWALTDLAAHLNKSPATITLYLSPDGLIPEAKQAFLNGEIPGFGHCYTIRTSPDQHAAFALQQKGATRKELQDERRKQANGKNNAEQPAKLLRIKIPVATETTTGAVTLSIPQDGDLAAVETLLKDAEKAVRLPRVKLTPARDDTPGTVTVARESIDPTAETLLKEALKLVQDAKTRKLNLKTARVEWDLAKPAPDAKTAQADQRDQAKAGSAS